MSEQTKTAEAPVEHEPTPVPTETTPDVEPGQTTADVHGDVIGL